MGHHVDIVINDFERSEQRRAAVAWVNGEFHLKWLEDEIPGAVPAELADPETGSILTRRQGAVFLRALVRTLDGHRVFATELHSETECPFAREVLPMAHLDSEGRVASRA